MLRGLDRPVAALSFEFQCAALDVEPFRILEALGSHRFAVSTAPFTLGLFGDAAEAWRQIEAFRATDPEGSGDVFARSA